MHLNSIRTWDANELTGSPVMHVTWCFLIFLDFTLVVNVYILLLFLPDWFRWIPYIIATHKLRYNNYIISIISYYNDPTFECFRTMHLFLPWCYFVNGTNHFYTYSFFGVVECVGHSFAYVAHLWFAEGYLDSNPQWCRSKRARCYTKPPIPLLHYPNQSSSVLKIYFKKQARRFYASVS